LHGVLKVKKVKVRVQRLIVEVQKVIVEVQRLIELVPSLRLGMHFWEALSPLLLRKAEPLDLRYKALLCNKRETQR